MKKVKILFTSSSGGHYEQLMMLRPLMERFDSYLLTEKTVYSSSKNNGQLPTMYLRQVNRREKLVLFVLLYNTCLSLVALLKCKPDYIISTGALATVPVLVLGKIMGKKIIFIESFAKIKSPTKTGRFVYKFADKFYVQWLSMKRVYPNAIFKGALY